MTEPKPQITEAGGPEHYPVLPLRDIVVFPYMIVPLFVGREKSIAALEEVMRSDKQILLADKDQLARNLSEKLLIYATGAVIQFADREVVEELVAKSRAQNYGFRSLVHDVVQSRPFLNK